MKMSGILVLSTAVFGIVAGPAVAKDYKINLNRPGKAGDRYRTNVTETKKQTLVVSKNGMLLSNMSKTEKMNLQGIVDVKAVDKEGNTLKLHLTIEKFVDGKGTELLKKGQVVVADSVNNKTVCSLKGGELSAEAKKQLESMLTTKTETSGLEDKAFGSKTPRKVGDKWDIDSKVVARLLKVKPQSISGTVEFQAVEKFAGHDCLRIGVTGKIGEFPGGDQLAKQGFEQKSLDFKLNVISHYPIDETIRGLQQNSNMSINAEFRGVKGQATGLNMNFVLTTSKLDRREILK